VPLTTAALLLLPFFMLAANSNTARAFLANILRPSKP